MGSFDFVTFFFFIAAVIIFLQLRSVLGRRTGNERQPYDPYSKRESAKATARSEDSKVVSLPRRADQSQKEARFEAIDAYAKPGSDLNAGLRHIASVDSSFDPKEFLEGAKLAYEMIITSYADGDRKALKSLLSRDVYDGFVAAINEREAKGETVKSSFIGVDKAEITQAELKGTEAAVTVRMQSQLISATHDKDGELIEGDPESVGEVNDVWTFARDTRSRDPNWKLIATESDA